MHASPRPARRPFAHSRWLACLVGLAPLVACSSSPAQDPTDPPVGGEAAGCDGAALRQNPVDFAAPGPWAVGARTATVGGLTVEVWYPAAAGSEAGKAKARYDIRAQLPAAEAAKISDADNPWQPCDCVRDLPLDEAHGPYPAVVFIHGTASFRHQSLTFATHWASRGFVVVAADHPGLKLGDLLAQACGGSAPAQDLSGDVDKLLAALAAPAGDLAFLAGRVDAGRVAVAGHSAGGSAAAAAAGKPGVRVVIPMAGAAVAPASPALLSALYFGGLADGIVSFGQVKTAYQGAAKPRRLVGLADAGHLNFSDLCETRNAAGMDMLTIAKDKGVCGANLAGFLFDCDPTHLPGPTGWATVNYVSSAVLEPALQCAAPVDLKAHAASDPVIAQYDEAL